MKTSLPLVITVSPENIRTSFVTLAPCLGRSAASFELLTGKCKQSLAVQYRTVGAPHTANREGG